MALCPFAVHELLPENNTQNRINPTTVICHRAVSSAQDLYGYWNSPGIELESHFYVGPDGTIYQYMDTSVRADANVLANAFAVSIETWDGGNTPDSMGWNAVQVAALKKLIKWICDVHGIRRAPAQTWNGGGIGGHNWFPEPWADGPRGCPGTARNNQLRNDIIPAVASGNIEEIVTEAEMNAIAERAADRVVAKLLWEVDLTRTSDADEGPIDGTFKYGWLLQGLDAKFRYIKGKLDDLEGSGIPAVVDYRQVGEAAVEATREQYNK